MKQIEIPVDGAFLAAWAAEGTAGSGRALVLCHSFPTETHRLFPAESREAEPEQSYQQLAQRLASGSGWTVVSFDYRGTGESSGDFSLGGWTADIHAVTRRAAGEDRQTAVWLAGFGVGGSLALCAAGEDQGVRGVAAFGAPAGFEGWAADGEALLASALQLGLVRTGDAPPDPAAWARELAELAPLVMAGKVAPRPLLVVHGSDDEVVPVVEARALADAGGGGAELRVLPGAGHHLRHDPRAVALLLGWLERQEAQAAAGG